MSNYIVTARKWRPQTFLEVIGQEHISRTLINAVKNKRIAHAYLFAGPRGVGKTTTARILAKTLNCLDRQDGEPCNKCDMCKAFLAAQTMDIIEIDGASNRRIEEIRTLRESVKYAPTRGSYKVYIIDEVHMLTTESFNALLKTLEEPPEHTIFIFATTDVHKVPATIISRCQRFDFRRIEIRDIKSLLSKIAAAENISIDDESLTIIAKKADGALRDAQSLFDQVISFCGTDVKADILKEMLNLIDEETYFDLSDAILATDFKQAFQLTSRIYDNGWNFIDFMNGLIEHFRNILTVIIRKDTKLIEAAEIYHERYLTYKDKFSEGDMLRILTFLNKTLYELKSSQNQRLKLEVSLAQMIGFEKSETITNLIYNLENSPSSFLSTEKKKAELKEEPKEEKPIQLIKPEEPEIKLPPPPPPLPPEERTAIKEETDEKAEDQEKKEKPAPSRAGKNITDDWSYFVETVNSERFGIGSHLLRSAVKEVSGKDIIVNVSSEDAEILDQKDKLTFLTQTAEKLYGTGYSFTFNVAKFDELPVPAEHTEAAEDLILEDTPLTTALKEILSAREIM